MPYSPAAAAKKAGVSRAVVIRAVQDGSLRATKKNNGHWSIPDDALAEWMEKVTIRAPAEKPASRDASRDDEKRIAKLESDLDAVRLELKETVGKLHEAREKIATLNAAGQGLHQNLKSTQADRDAWKEQAQKLADLKAEARPSFLRRIFGGK
jgi:excisionase family DNA binding protein